MGWEYTLDGAGSGKDGSGGDADGVFRAGPYPPSGSNNPYAVGGSIGGDPIVAYRLTLTNDSQVTADVTGFAVTFYGTTGTEAGSDQESASGFITPGQALSWTLIEDHTVSGYGDDSNQQLAQTASIPANAATCQLVQWSSGGGS